MVSQPRSYRGAICLRTDGLLKHTNVIRAFLGVAQDRQTVNGGEIEDKGRLLRVM